MKTRIWDRIRCCLIVLTSWCTSLSAQKLPPIIPPAPTAIFEQPTAGTSYLVGQGLDIVATAWDPQGEVRHVEFWLDGKKTAESWHECRPCVEPPCFPCDPLPIVPGAKLRHSWTWESPTLGNHQLVAKVLQADGSSLAIGEVSFAISSQDEAIPSVSIRTRDVDASELDSTNIVIFEITRSFKTDQPLRVFFNVDGTAKREADYQLIPESMFVPCLTCKRAYVTITDNFIDIPAGETTVLLGARASSDAEIEGSETLVVNIQGAPVPAWAGARPPYTIGNPSESLGIIVEGDEPSPSELPQVSIHLTDGTAVEGDPNDTLIFLVQRRGSSEAASTIWFEYGGSATFGSDYVRVNSEGQAVEFTGPQVENSDRNFGWVEIPAGQKLAKLYFKANADDLKEGSESLAITLILPIPKPTERIRPTYEVAEPSSSKGSIEDRSIKPGSATVSLVSPADGSIFYAVQSLGLNAIAIDPDGYISELSIFANGRLIGTSSLHFLVPPSNGTPITHSVNWLQPPIGKYSIVAVGKSSTGNEIKSESVSISVQGKPDGGSTAPIVTIRAIDRSAVETNKADIAIFEVQRNGDVSGPLKVRFVTGGEAERGVDYYLIPESMFVPCECKRAEIIIVDNTIEFPAGIKSVLIGVRAASDGIPDNGETVVLRLDPPVVIALVGAEPPYQVGQPSEDKIQIFDSTPVSDFPKVTIVAEDATAEEPQIFPGSVWNEDAGMVFRVDRTGDLTNPLTVWFQWRGTALPFVDFDWASQIGAKGFEPHQCLPGFETYGAVTIPAGQTADRIYLRALPDALREGSEDLTIHLVQPIRPNPSPLELVLPTYFIGEPSAEKGVIYDARSNPGIPVVTIQTIRPQAWEKNPALIGVAEILRNGFVDLPLTVHFETLGNAIRGTDYFLIPESMFVPCPLCGRPEIILTGNTIEIPAGQKSVLIGLRAADDEKAEGPETAGLQLVVPVIISQEGPKPPYSLGISSRSEITIHDGVPPVDPAAQITIISPADGASFPTGSTIEVLATAAEDGGYVPDLTLSANGKVIGQSSIRFIQAPEPGTVITHSFKWENVTKGIYELVAWIPSTDSSKQRNSKPIRIIVDELKPGGPVVVSIRATAPTTSESTPLSLVLPGVFTLERTGSLEAPVQVFYKIGGTAENGIDYVKLDGDATIPAGVDSRRILVVGTYDQETEGPETVELTLLPGRGYGVSETSTATVTITDSKPTPPDPKLGSLVMTGPFDKRLRIEPASATVSARAMDPKGYIEKVEFFANNRSIGISTLNFIQAPPPGTPVDHSIEWNEIPAGSYQLTARAVTAGGTRLQADPIFLSVSKNENPLNKAVLTITAPKSGARLSEGESVPVQATAIDPKGEIRRVEYWVDGKKLGESNHGCQPCVEPPCFPCDPLVPVPGTVLYHEWTWDKAPVGEHKLQARAIQANGQAIASEVVTIQVGRIITAPPTLPGIPAEGSELDLSLKKAPLIHKVEALPEGVVRIVMLESSGSPGCDLEVSTDLKTWLKIAQMPAGVPCNWVDDTDADESDHRFYRVVRRSK